MSVPPAKVKNEIADDLDGHAYTRWPDLEEITIRWRGSYGYLQAWITETHSITLCRLEYLGSATDWRYALYDQSTAGYQDAELPTGAPTGTPEEALEHAMELYLTNPEAWQNPPTN